MSYNTKQSEFEIQNERQIQNESEIQIESDIQIESEIQNESQKQNESQNESQIQTTNKKRKQNSNQYEPRKKRKVEQTRRMCLKCNSKKVMSYDSWRRHIKLCDGANDASPAYKIVENKSEKSNPKTLIHNQTHADPSVLSYFFSHKTCQTFTLLCRVFF